MISSYYLLAESAFTGSRSEKDLIPGNGVINKFVVIHNSPSGVLDEDSKLFLGNILKSIGRSAETAIVLPFTDEKPVLFHVLKREVDPAFLLSFGLPPARLGLQVHVENYVPFDFRNVRILFAGELSLIEKDKNSKSHLWQGLKKMLGV